MCAAMAPLQRIRLEKAAADCGFERLPVLTVDGFLELRSACFPESLLLRPEGGAVFRVEAPVAALLGRADDGVVLVSGISELYVVLQHAAAVARNRPNRVADRFRRATQRLPQTTEAERLVVQRIGQDLFRHALLDYWQGRCCVTGLAVPSLLRASHIKPWALCESDEERLDVFNGLLLSPNLDALFDQFLISFTDDGVTLVNDQISLDDRRLLGLSGEMRLKGIAYGHRPYLAFHRQQFSVQTPVASR